VGDPRSHVGKGGHVRLMATALGDIARDWRRGVTKLLSCNNRTHLNVDAGKLNFLLNKMLCI
jgi:hypothetical protein